MSRRYDVRVGGSVHTVEVIDGGTVRVGAETLHVEPLDDTRCRVTRADGTHSVIARAGTTAAPWLFASGQAWQLEVTAEGARARAGAASTGEMIAPMPATVVSIAAMPGAKRGRRRSRGGPRGHEDGAGRPGAPRRRRRGRALSRRRAGDEPGHAGGAGAVTTGGRRIAVVEVGPRDGLQNEAAAVPTDRKIAFVDALGAAGHTTIEVSAFVSPKWVPQMADAAEVFAGIARRAGVRYTALVPNLAGLARAVAAGVDEVAVFAAASERFSLANVNQSIDDSLARYAEVCAAARIQNLPVRGYVSCAFGCPFEGAVSADAVVRVTRALLAMGAYEVAVSDTIGVAHPGQVRTLLARLAADVPPAKTALHFHDTRGTALANVLAALDAGIDTFDASAGGLGGCPYAPGASGNLATEDLLYMLDGLGLETGVSLDRVMAASIALQPALGHPLRSRVVQAAQASAGRT